MPTYEHVVTEDFRSLNHLMEELRKRPNSNYMRDVNNSQETDSDSFAFTGTRSYEEAEQMLVNGYLEVLDKLRSDIKEKNKINAKYAADIAHPTPHTSMIGFCPCVPNAILGLPNSMISVDRKPMKRKTLSILYCPRGHGGKTQEWFIDAGVALLSAIDLVEKSGIEVQLKICIKYSQDDSGYELTFPTVMIKDYGERYSLQKISFPVAHPSIFRRIGFKWLETSPDIRRNYGLGYGRPPVDFDLAKSKLVVDKNTYLITTNDIQNHNCDVAEVLRMLEVI